MIDGVTRKISIGFTGSRKGMNQFQIDAVSARISHWIALHGPVTFRHGDSLKADAQAHDMAFLMGCQTASHPSTLDKHRAFCAANCVREPREPLLRNQDIVSESLELIACPSTRYEIRRSGTWSTIRYARRIGRPIYLIYPDRIEYEG